MPFAVAQLKKFRNSISFVWSANTQEVLGVRGWGGSSPVQNSCFKITSDASHNLVILNVTKRSNILGKKALRGLH